ncbi:MAG: biotin/lipoyl-binding protein, partial [Achromobacter pestifer]
MQKNPGETQQGVFGSLWRKLRNVFVFFFDRLLDGADKGKLEKRSDYVGNAEWVIHESQARSSRILLWVALIATALLLVWAAMGNIDEVVRGEGKVVPSRQVQIIQSLDGGIVEEILVRPGQEVEAGQTLLKIDSTRFASSLGENNAEYLSLLAKSARLQALATGEPFVAPEEVLKQAPGLAEMERNAWQARNTELNATINVAREQLKQRQEDLRETIAKRDQASASCGLTSRELQVTRPLLKSGAVSEVDLLRLQRDVARYCGEQ